MEDRSEEREEKGKIRRAAGELCVTTTERNQQETGDSRVAKAAPETPANTRTRSCKRTSHSPTPLGP